MAYVNGRFENENYEIKIEVLEPTVGESDFDEGLKIMVDWDSFIDVSLVEFRKIIKWMNERADNIESNFYKSGKVKSK